MLTKVRGAQVRKDVQTFVSALDTMFGGFRERADYTYRLLRAPLHDLITYRATVQGCGLAAAGGYVDWTEGATGRTCRLDGIDLLVAGDGRYSAIRQLSLGGPEAPRFLDVCLYRVLFPAGPDCPLDDYGQWFNGPNRLLAYRVPGGFVYCAGSFPIPPSGGVPADMKRPEALRAAFGLPVHLSDERLTTSEAHLQLHAMGKPRQEHRALVDQVAAVLILEGFLAAREYQTARFRLDDPTSP